MLSKKQEEECIYIAVRISILIIVFCLSASIVHHVKY